MKLGYYGVNGHKVQLANGTMTIPSSLAGAISGTVGINQYMEATSLARAGNRPVGQAGAPAQEPAPPAGFRNPQPCSAFWEQKIDTKDSGQLYKPFTHPLPYDICGYKSAQLRGAYGLNRSVASGNNGKDVTIAIVGAYDSPTLLADAQQYFRLNNPAHPVVSSKFINVTPRRWTTRLNAPPAAGSTSRRSMWSPRTPLRRERPPATSERRVASTRTWRGCTAPPPAAVTGTGRLT